MNELQKKELVLLEYLNDLCEKNGIPYYLVCGTALGAIKYNGFIPWDDDIDVAMCRCDYEKFLIVANEKQDSRVIVQNHLSDKNISFIYTKLRLQNTTFIEKTVSKTDISHGVYIDVFPLDGYPSDKMKAFIFERKKKLFCRMISSTYYRDKLYKNVIMTPLSLVTKLFRSSLVNAYEQLITSYSCDSSKLWCNFGNSPSNKEYADKEQYGNGVIQSFEGLKICVPEKYDEYLTQKYGDWRADLPKEQQVGHHYAEIIDTTRPYTDYIVKLKNGKIRLKTSAELLRDGITPPENYKY